MRQRFLVKHARALTSACVFLAAICCYSTAQAQRRAWTVTQPSSATRALSIGIPGKNADFKYDFEHGVALLRTTEESGELAFIAIDLSSGRTLGRGGEPDGWSWETTVVGEKFACCTSKNEIMLLELASCEIVARTSIRIPGALSILFDKALWMAPCKWYVMPSLKPVEKHHIVDPVAADRLIYGMGNTKPWMLSPKEAVINGLVYGSDLRPANRFFGHFTDPASPGNDTNRFTGRFRSSRSSRAGKEERFLNFTGLQRIGAEHPNIEIILPSSVQVGRGDAKLAAFREGICGVFEEHLLVVVFDKEQQVLLRGDVLTCPPPLISWEDAYSGPVSRASGRDVLEFKLIHPEFDFEIGLDPATQTITAGLKNGDTLKFANDKRRQMEIARGVWRMSQLGMDSAWEEVVAAYKRNNMNWLAPYASAVNRGFKGVPVELPVEVTLQFRQPFSVVIDFPEPVLREGYAMLQAERSMAVKNDAEEVFGELLRRSKRTELPQNEPLPPAEKPPIPDGLDVATIRGGWNLDAETTFIGCMVPVPIFFRWLVLMGVIAYFNRGTNGPHDAIVLAGGKLIGPLLFSAVWVLMSTGFVFILGAAREQWLGEDVSVVLLVATLNLILDAGIVFVLLPFASRRSIGEIAPLAAAIVGILIGFVVAIFVLAFMMGVIAGMLKP